MSTTGEVGYGTGALLGRGITRVKDVLWLDELGIAQAIWVLEVENFGPFIVDSDLAGNSLFAQQGELVNQRIAGLYEGLRRPALHRKRGCANEHGRRQPRERWRQRHSARRATAA